MTLNELKERVDKQIEAGYGEKQVLHNDGGYMLEVIELMYDVEWDRVIVEVV